MVKILNFIPFKTLLSQLTVTFRNISTFAGNTGATDGSQVDGSDVIEFFDPNTTNNASDRGDTAIAKSLLSGAFTSGFGFCFGGRDTAVPINPQDQIESIDATLLSGNSLNRGDLTLTLFSLASSAGSTFAFSGGGVSSATDQDVIDSIDGTTQSVANAIDKGDLTQARRNPAAYSGSTRTFWGGGFLLSPFTQYDIIDFINNTTQAAGNASDSGDLSTTMVYHCGAGANGIAFSCGGNFSAADTVIETFSSEADTVTVSDKGDLTVARRQSTAEANQSKVYIICGKTDATTTFNIIDEVDAITGTENATDHADTTESKAELSNG